MKKAMVFLCLGFINGKVYGMEQVFSWVATTAMRYASDNLPTIVSEGKDFLYGRPKTYEEQFKEHVFNREHEKLQTLVAKKVDGMKQELDRKFPGLGGGVSRSSYFSAAECRESLNKMEGILRSYALSLLKMDYVDATKRELERAIIDINALEIKPDEDNYHLKTERKEKTVAFLESQRKNLCAYLYTRYTYKREGGCNNRRQRHEEVQRNRLAYWGFNDIPSPTREEIPDIIKKLLNEDNSISAILRSDKGGILPKSEKTIRFILKLDSDVFAPDNQKGLEFYKKQYQDFFGFVPTEVKYEASFIQVYYRSVNQYERPFSSQPQLGSAIKHPSRLSDGEGSVNNNSASYSPSQPGSLRTSQQQKRDSNSLSPSLPDFQSPSPQKFSPPCSKTDEKNLKNKEIATKVRREISSDKEQKDNRGQSLFSPEEKRRKRERDFHEPEEEKRSQEGCSLELHSQDSRSESSDSLEEKRVAEEIESSLSSDSHSHDESSQSL